MDLSHVRISKLAGGFRFTEGPVLHANGDISFTDIFNDRIHRLHPDGSVETLTTPQRPNGLALDAEERVYACLGGDRCIARLETDGILTPLTDRYNGKRLNSPNDIVFGPNGRIYFTDPPWAAPDARELDVAGVYMLTQSCEPAQLTDGLSYPNGLAFSPDGSQLYVSNSKPPPERALHVFDVRADGTLSAGRILAPMLSDAVEVPDGLKVHRSGLIFCTGPGGVWVFRPDGEHLGTLVAPEVPANCAFSTDHATLFMTARTSLYAADLSELPLA